MGLFIRLSLPLLVVLCITGLNANGLQMTDKQWDTMLAIHNTAPFKLVRAAAPYFRVKDGEDRVVVNISSTSGIHGNAYGPPIPPL